jgi:hypothetical protein
MRPRLALGVFLVGAFLSLGCGDDQDPDAAAELWTRIHTENYRSWARAPGYETRQASNAAHGDAVDIYVDNTVSIALAVPGIIAWPMGSLIVKDGFDNGDLELVAAMEKRGDGWFWVEWNTKGEASYSGKPSLCIDCHEGGADSVRAFPLP